MATPVGALGKLREHARLPDPGLSHERQRSRLTAVEICKDRLDRAELVRRVPRGVSR